MALLLHDFSELQEGDVLTGINIPTGQQETFTVSRMTSETSGLFNRSGHGRLYILRFENSQIISNDREIRIDANEVTKDRKI